jgi:hypothetical protein
MTNTTCTLFQSDLVANALRRLEQLTSDLRRPAQLTTGLRHSTKALQRINDTGSIAETMFRILEGEMVRSDDIDLPIHSEDELIFRAARLVVLHQLDRLEQEILSMGGAGSGEDGEHSTWVRLLEGIPTGRREIRRLSDAWRSIRGRDPTGVAVVTRSTSSKAVASVLIELQRIDRLPILEPLLYRGVASREWPAIARSCELILTASKARIDVQAARSLWAARDRWREQSTANDFSVERYGRPRLRPISIRLGNVCAIASFRPISPPSTSGNS